MKTLLTVLLLIPNLSWGLGDKFHCYMDKYYFKNGEIEDAGGFNKSENLVYYVEIPLLENKLIINGLNGETKEFEIIKKNKLVFIYEVEGREVKFNRVNHVMETEWGEEHETWSKTTVECIKK